ncbi:MAG: LLM class flavin-dependent oxidoreductase [Candidatus Rokubacteria bacterium]|nr:LLM class flavin-dependent oxidoreductase [Candidatus Rokubacteria bacterium]
MSLAFAIMIEAQEGLTWERWEGLARAAEAGPWESLFRSDHLTGLFGEATRPSLDAWASLTWLASHTRRIRFGPLVSPLTFYHPALLAKRAAAVDQLSGGRLDLGIGAGWNDYEHRMFGVPFPGLRERLDRLECGARAIRALWRGGPVTVDQPYYPLVDAQSSPLPVSGRLVIGGRGERRTLRIVAEFADEWNVTRVTLEEFAAKRAVLDRHCRDVRRDPAAIALSLMVPVIVGATPAEIAARVRRAVAIFPRLPADAAGWRAAGFLYGTPDEIVADLKRWEAAGMRRVMLQMVDMDDRDAIELLATNVLPAFR